MQIGIRLHDCKAGALEERLERARAQGFTCGHIALNKLGMPYENDALTEEYAKRIKSTFKDAGMKIAVLGNYLNLAHPDEEKLRSIQKRYYANLRFAAQIGATVVGTETGAPNEAYRYDKEACHSKEALETFITNLRPVVEEAEKCGSILAIEPVYKHIVWNPKRAREVLDRIGSPNLKIIFDPVNLLAPENLDQREEVLEEAMDLLRDEIVVVHLKDYVLEDKDGEQVLTCMAPGLGEMDYRSVLRFVKTYKPHIQATLENTKPENAKAARVYLQKLYDEI